ncbi:MAG: hypothetical protein QM731_02085 [Chitinophagaceae bacterium]
MQIVGFTKEKDKNIVKAKYLEDISLLNKGYIKEFEKEQVINYIEKGKSIYFLTLSLLDGDKYIGPYMILSDGVWLWPSHFSHYLKKLNFSNLDFRFLEYIRNTNYETTPLTQSEVKAVTVFLETELLNIK